MTRLSSRRLIARTASKRRNFGLVAHVDAGKTTVSERILYFTGRTHKLGEVHDGQATMDHLEEEQKRGITITAAATTCEWKDHQLSLIDTPGHIDFTVEVERSLRVLDGAVGVFCAVGGVEPQSQTVWRQADRYGVPRMAFINKMDRSGADFDTVIGEIRKKLYAHPLVIGAPMGEGGEFKGILDVVREKALFFDPDEKLVSVLREEDVPAEYQEKMAKYREHMFEELSAFDDDLMEAYLEGDPTQIPLPLIKQALRSATISKSVTPVMCGSALKNIGVRFLLDAICDYLPAPEDHPPLEGHDPDTGEELLRARTEKAPTTMLAFKTVAEQSGDLTFFRIYSGTVNSDSVLYNPRTKSDHRVGRLLKMHANRRENIDSAKAGELFAVLGMKDVATGDTLADPAHKIELEAPLFPEPVITCSISTAKSADRDKLAKALSRLGREDPTFRRYTDEVTGETIIGGMGELHLEICLNRIQNDFRVAVETGKPQVAYRQRLKKAIEIESRYIKQTGGSGQYAVAKIRFEPVDDVDGLEWLDETKGGVVPKEYIPSIERGIKNEMAEGGELRYPIVGMRATLVDGKAHDTDSSDRAFEACARQAMRMIAEQVGFHLLEPVLRFHVTVPETSGGNINGDLNTRRASIESFETEKGMTRIAGLVPASEMFQYNNTLMSQTQGQGQFSLEPDSYGKVPDAIADEVRKTRKEQLHGIAAAK